MKRTFLFTSAAVAATCLLVQPVIAQTVVTSFAPDSLFPAAKVWYENDVRTGGTASIADLTGTGGNLETNQPLPIGAALITTDFTNDAKAEVGVPDDYGIPNDIFSTLNLSYSYFKAANATQNSSAAPALKLTFSGGFICSDCNGTLVYEPYWNGSNAPSGADPTQDQWITATIDENSGYFWSTGMFGSINSGGGPPNKTLAEWKDTLDAAFRTSTLILVSVGVGSYNQGQIGYFDDVSIAHSTYNESYDFEPPAPPAPSIVCEGFQAPMNKTVSVKKKNRVLPLKMVCFDADGNELTDADLAAAPLVEVDYTGGDPTIPTGDDFLPAGQGDDGNQFIYSGNAWQFNLQTKNFSGSGVYIITAVSGDSSYVIDPFPVAEFVIQ